MTAWRLLLTRPAEESAVLAQLLADNGIYSSSLPLLETAPLDISAAQLGPILELHRYCAVIVVSKPAARQGIALLDQWWPQPPIQSWFSVGASTGQLLRDYGLDVAWPEQGDDSEALLDLSQFQEATDVPGARVLILRGENGREILAERLRERGVSVDYLPLYRRFLPDYPPLALPQRVTEEHLNGLVVSSGEGFAHLQQLAGAAWAELAALPLFVPSPRVAEMARAAGARTVVDCRGANVAALLAALRAYPAPAVQAS